MKKKPDNQETSITRSSTAEYLTFVAAGGDSEASVEMRYEDENIWLTQKMMAALYDVSIPAINQHLKRFFAAVQNKMHYAVHGQTAAEVIVDRADHQQENMGLTSWEGVPKDKIHRYDVSIAKNYLSEFELGQMQRIVQDRLFISDFDAEMMRIDKGDEESGNEEGGSE